MSPPIISHGACRRSDPITGVASTLLIRSGDGPVLIHPDIRGSEGRYGVDQTSRTAATRCLVPRQAGFAPPAVPHLMSRTPRSPLPRPHPPARARPQTASMEHRCCPSDIDGTSLSLAGGRRDRPGPPGARLAGRVRLTGHTGPGVAGPDTAPGYRRDSLLTEGSCQGKPNLPRGTSSREPTLFEQVKDPQPRGVTCLLSQERRPYFLVKAHTGS
jgi:hypothetical protein